MTNRKNIMQQTYLSVIEVFFFNSLHSSSEELRPYKIGSLKCGIIIEAENLLFDFIQTNVFVPGG